MENNADIYPGAGNEAAAFSDKSQPSLIEHGKEIQEIISNKPPLIVRWGTFYFFILLSLIAFISSFIKYPTVLKAKATIQRVSQPGIYPFAELIIPPKDREKVSIGQKVILKFPSYPFKEYGSVVGKIGSISNQSSCNGYLIKLVLPDGLTTLNKKKILYEAGLQADGEIVLSETSLLGRFYYGMRKSTKSR
ncbi:MAG: hypothetical protein H7Y86_06610 [Rhizobacter sp.]|nr:hypothetical protein [Ferruginibacter sp.]